MSFIDWLQRIVDSHGDNDVSAQETVVDTDDNTTSSNDK